LAVVDLAAAGWEEAAGWEAVGLEGADLEAEAGLSSSLAVAGLEEGAGLVAAGLEEEAGLAAAGCPQTNGGEGLVHSSIKLVPGCLV
jgi:hypothetical protein